MGFKMNVAVLITFVLYFIVMMGVGLFFYKKTNNIEDYLLGGRGMGSWVTALSAQASDMSGWLLMGLPGAVYLYGVGQAWIAIGLFIGTVANWLLVAKRLRVQTEETSSLTLSTFFEKKFNDPTGLLRIISALIILIFFTIYTSSGLVAAGKLFNGVFGLPYGWSVVIGAVVMIMYTFLGGFMAVCWTDLLQGALMFVAIIVVPSVALSKNGGFEAVGAAMQAKEISASLFRDSSGAISFVAIISAMAWGLGYFGQPHILSRFMSIKSVKLLPRTISIAVVWVFISLVGAIVVGLVGIAMFDSLPDGENETVFIQMINGLFNPWIGGVLLAAILAAIMSTIDSQLLVSSSALTEDFYQHIIKRDAKGKELIWVGRFCVLIIAVIAVLLALKPDSSVLDLVAYAWGGFGAAFGPVVLVALYSKRTKWFSAFAGMVVGTLTVIIWKEVGLGATMYEIVPGFILNFATIGVVNFIAFLVERKKDKASRG
ncbi:MAG: sodium/proline symporter PutP [Spirochaetales bacterium]|nr:sodium/proline symporter PutP [Spirochaetales bacterium]